MRSITLVLIVLVCVFIFVSTGHFFVDTRGFLDFIPCFKVGFKIEPRFAGILGVIFEAFSDFFEEDADFAQLVLVQ